MALEEPDVNFTTFQTSGIDVYIHPELAKQLEQFGGVLIDFIDNGPDQRGFTIMTRNKPAGMDCSSGCPSSSGCGSEEHDDEVN